jgi:hypothetical protein
MGHDVYPPAGFFPIEKKLEIYGATSRVLGEDSPTAAPSATTDTASPVSRSAKPCRFFF